MLKSAWEIALEKHEQHEDLSRFTGELLERVALLEECWSAIRPPEPEADSGPGLELAELADRAA